MKPERWAELALMAGAFALALAGKRSEHIVAIAGSMAQRGEQLLRGVSRVAGEDAPPPPREGE